MIQPGFEEIMNYHPAYTIAPVYQEIYADLMTPITMLRKVQQAGGEYFLLESVERGERWGRYSFLGISPILKASCKDGCVSVEGEQTYQTQSDQPLGVLKELLASYTSPQYDELPPFTGGFMGNLSYSMVRYAEPSIELKSGEFNDFDLMLFDKIIAYDHLKQKICIIANMRLDAGLVGYEKACDEIAKIIAMITKDEEPTEPKVPQRRDQELQFQCNLSKEEYCDVVKQMKQYILDGDIFQAVVARRFEALFEGSLLDTYRVLRTSNPSPYMFYVKMDDLEYAGTSPESLIKLKAGRLTTYPVAGTRPRGATKAEDLALEEGLLKDVKELAEHNMLVDLARNDLGRIAKYGSVEVEEYMQIHRYSKVMHITSIVAAELRSDQDAFDALAAMLPAGTLSGAPKIRACQIIEQLEPQARGLYGGAIGYIDFAGNMDTCIAIRMAVKKGSKVYVQAGGGVVYDSVPEMEYEESSNKAGAIIEALQRAGEVKIG